MLLQLRKSANTWLAKILLFGVLIFAFGIWGIADVFTPNEGNESVIEVGDQSINLLELERAFQNDLASFNLQEITPQQAAAIGLLQVTVERLINNNLLHNEVNNLWLNVSDKTVRKASELEPAFQNETGNFDPNRFRFALSNAGLNEDRYIQIMRQNIAQNWLQDSLVSNVQIDDSISNHLTAWRSEKRKGYMLRLDWNKQELPKNLDEAQLQAFFKKNQNSFISDEYRKIEIAIIEPSNFIDRVSVDIEELETEYDARESEFITPEKRVFVQYLSDNKEIATQVHALLLQNKTWSDIEKQIPKNTTTRVELGAIKLDDIYEDNLRSAAAKLQDKGTITQPTETSFGWAMLLLLDITPEKIIPFDSVRTGIENELKLVKAADIAFEVANEFEDILASGSSLREASLQLDLRLEVIENIGHDGFTPDGKQPLATLQSASNLLEQLFQLEENSTTELINEASDNYIIGSVLRITPSHLPDFAIIESDVRAAWHENLRMQAAQAKADAILATPESFEKRTALAKHGKIIEIKPTSRIQSQEGNSDGNASDNVTMQAAQRILFQIDEQKAMRADTTDSTLLVVRERFIPQTKDNNDLPATIQAQYQHALEEALMQDLLADLRRKQDVSINQNAIDALYQDDNL